MKFPALSLTGTGVLGIFAVFVVIAAGIYAYTKRTAIISAVNPVDPNNMANRAVTNVVSAVTGRDETLGGWLYDFTHPAIARAISNPPLASAAAPLD